MTNGNDAATRAFITTSRFYKYVICNIFIKIIFIYYFYFILFCCSWNYFWNCFWNYYWKCFCFCMEPICTLHLHN